MSKKIGVVVMSLEVGGTERHLAHLLPGLVSRGWSPRVYTLIGKGPIAEQLEAQNIPIELVLDPTSKMAVLLQKMPRLLSRFFRLMWATKLLAKKIKTAELDMLHFFLPESYIVGMLAAGLAKFRGPLMMSRRSLNDYQKNFIGSRFIEQKLHEKTSLILGNSLAIIEELKEEGVKQDKLGLIYNGIDVTPFLNSKPRSEVRRSLNISEDAFVMIMVANFIPYKGHADLLEALSEIREVLPPWNLLLVGRDNGLGEILKREAKEKKLNHHILWLGTRVDIPDLLNASDVGILSSHEEGFSNAILEGMAAALPMIVTDVGGNKEAVLEGETGFVVPPKNKKALAKAILTVARDLGRAKELGKKGRARVIASFSLQASIEAYHERYTSLMRR